MPNSGYDQLLSTVARQQAAIETLTGRLAEVTGRLAQMDTLAQENTALRTRLSRAEQQADTAVRTATGAQRTLDGVQNTIQSQAAAVSQAATGLAAVESQVSTLSATVAALPPPDAAMGDVFVRLSRVEEAAAVAAQQATEQTRTAVAAVTQSAQTAVMTARAAEERAAEAVRAVDSYAADMATQIAGLMGQRAEIAGLPDDSVTALAERITVLEQSAYIDPVLATARSRGGLQVPDSAIVGVAASKLTGDVPSAQMSTNVVAAVNASAGGVSAAKVSTGDLPQAQMQTNVVGAINAAGTGVSAAVLSTGNLGSGRMSANVMAAITASGTDLALGAGQKAGFYGTTPPAQQAVTALTNNVASGGTANQLDNYTDLTSYANDAAAIRANLYRLGEQVNLLRTAIRAYGLLS